MYVRASSGFTVIFSIRNAGTAVQDGCIQDAEYVGAADSAELTPC